MTAEEARWHRIFQTLSEDGGNTVKWNAMERALNKMRMDICVQELELLGLTRQVMDFTTFVKIIKSGMEQKRDICRGARMVESKRATTSYNTDYETVEKSFDCPTDHAVDRIMTDMQQRFGNGDWGLVPHYHKHPDFAVEGGIVRVFRYLPDGMGSLWTLFASSHHLLILGYHLLYLVVVNPTHDQDYYVAKRKELQAKLDADILKHRVLLDNARKRRANANQQQQRPEK